MARPIKPPILFGEDARAFERRMQEKRSKSSEDSERRLRNYYACLDMPERGKHVKMKTR